MPQLRLPTLLMVSTHLPYITLRNFESAERRFPFEFLGRFLGISPRLWILDRTSLVTLCLDTCAMAARCGT